MSLNRRNPRRDQSEPEVIETLEACGWTVKRISGSGLPDLICLKRGQVRFVEAKTGKRKLCKSQEWWEGILPVAILRNRDEALQWNQEQMR